MRRRGAPVIGAILEATLEELAGVGYGALTMEGVAARAGVNKTTVYRRWPSRDALVREALAAVPVVPPELPDTGSLRGDLLAIARGARESLTSPAGKGVTRLALAGPIDPELMAILRAIAAAENGAWSATVERARRRGELRANADTMVLLEALGGAIIHRLFLAHRDADEAWLRRLIDLLTDGVTRVK